MIGRGRLIHYLRLAVLPCIIAVGFVIAWKQGYFDLDRRHQLATAARELATLPWVEELYVLGYGVTLAFLLPATIATLIGGALFGPLKGALLAWLGAMFGTVVTHLLARHVARAPMRRLFGDNRLLRQLRDHTDLLGLFRLRVLPVAPFATLDYAAGVAGVSLVRLLIATSIGVIPSVIAYAYVGSELMRGIVTGKDASQEALWIAGSVTLLMFALSIIPRLLQRRRQPSGP